ncbi:hypothetical protein [Algibacter sp. 2305UL17-15]|uniref:hypothetical protein n=1 Tax=Algibacter sp. 2305UL17-15 TaxID=3231268 RepID=UPI00345A4048
MKIYNYKGIILDEVKGVITIRLDLSKIELCKKIIKDKKINSISINYNPNKISDIDFLKDPFFCEINSIHVTSKYITNVEGLYSLKKLERLSINDIGSGLKIDFNKLTTLKAISFVWSKNFINIDKLVNLERFVITKYPHKDLLLFSNCKVLNHLELIESKIVTLEGLGGLNRIVKIQLFYNKNLQSLKGISKDCDKLTSFGVYSAPKLYEINAALSHANKLKNIMLSKVKKVDSLKFLDLMLELKDVQIKSEFIKLADNDYKPLERAIRRVEKL